MYLRDLKASLVRRWYLVLVGLLITGALGFATLRLVPPSYEANASDVLLPPRSSVAEDGNPFLYLGGLSQALDVLTRSLQSDASQRAVIDAHPSVTYTAAPDRTTTGPILLITTEASTSEAAMAGLQSVLGLVEPTLTKLQDDLSVPAESRITVMQLAIDEQPTAVRKDQTRALLAVVAIGLVGTILLIGLIDGLLLTRRSKRIQAKSADEEPPPTAQNGRVGHALGPRRRSGPVPTPERVSRGAKTEQRTP